MTSMSPERREKYLQAQDVTSAPQWAVNMAARRKELTAAEKSECVARLRDEHGWTFVRIAKLFGVAADTPRQWLTQGTEGWKDHQRDLREARARADPYRGSRYARKYTDRLRHGKDAGPARTDLWKAQDGLCYLCGDPLGPGRMAVIDHDHRCCPPGRSCEICRRGLACRLCNWIAGYAFDDPDRLERIAANLRSAVASVTERMKDAEAS